MILRQLTIGKRPEAGQIMHMVDGEHIADDDQHPDTTWCGFHFDDPFRPHVLGGAGKFHLCKHCQKAYDIHLQHQHGGGRKAA
jgi:hypothetical protein